MKFQQECFGHMIGKISLYLLVFVPSHVWQELVGEKILGQLFFPLLEVVAPLNSIQDGIQQELS
jgi:hypothetical protein